MSNLADKANLSPTEDRTGSADYLVDFVLWSERQAQLLRDIEQRRQIDALIEDSPSLKNELQARLEKSYASAISQAVHETGLAKSDFPAASPFSRDELIDADFIP
ncbi:MAG: DUF29 family protein [Telluria sp.]